MGIKIAIALISGSLAVKADALHSLTDVVSSVIILVGIKISKRPSRTFPYGLHKVENLVALGISLLILFAGYEILRMVLSGGSRPLPSQIPLAVVGVGLTILIAWLFSRYELKKGLETGSPSLVADAKHIWTDALSSLIILASLLGSAVGFALDKYAAMIVVIFIIRSAVTIFLDSVRVLLDASLDFTSLNKIRDLVLADSRVAQINELWARNAGRYKFVELDLTLRVNDLEKGHRITEELENRVKMEIEQVYRVLIHYQPKDQLTFAAPIVEDSKVIAEHILKNPFFQEEKAKGIKVAGCLLEKGLDVLISRHDEMPGTSDTIAGLDAKRKDGSRSRLNLLFLKSNQYIGFFLIVLLGLVISGGVGYYFGGNSKRKVITPHLVTAADQSSRQSAESNILNHAEQSTSMQASSQNPPQPAETKKVAAVPEIEIRQYDHKTPVKAEDQIIFQENKQKLLFSEEKIIGFLNNWIDAWKNTAGKQGDMNAYMACYSNYFNAKNLTKDGWQADKFVKNRAKKWIDVKLENVMIKEASQADSLEVSFLQTYQSSNYFDTSNKILILKKEETGWKIISER